jgi:23S rRNA pseudouridine2605 synthase
MDCQQRLQKIIAAAGLASRRKAELLISEGRVTVNGQIVTQLGAKADPERDYIKVDGKLVRQSPKKIYILLNKPRQVISSVTDPEGRIKVTDLVDVHTKIYPVGRLDYNTEGLILLTNDGAFAKIVSAAGNHLPKVYHVKVRSTPDASSLEHLRAGLRLKSGVRLARCKIVPLKERTNSWHEVTLTQGKNRQIRDMFEEIGCPVLKLRRVRIGFLTDNGLAIGQFRRLTPGEVERIKKIPDSGFRISD